MLLEQHFTHRRRRAASGYLQGTIEPVKLNFEAHGRVFEANLHAADGLFADGFSVTVVGDNGPEEFDDFDKSVFYHGSLKGESAAMVSAHIDDGVLVGTIHTPLEEFFIERADKYIKGANFSNIIYRGSDMIPPEDHQVEYEGTAFGAMLERQRAILADKEQNETSSDSTRRRRQTVYNPSMNTCGVALVADKRFMDNGYFSSGSHQVSAAVRALIGYLDGASLIYRATPFSRQVGSNSVSTPAIFAAKRVITYITDTANPYSGTASCSAAECAGQECAQEYLDMLSSSGPDGGGSDWDDYCLVHAFTHRDFCGGILGLAWVAQAASLSAGICANRGGGTASLNTGISTTINFGSSVSLQVQIITLAHEFGHNFGSNHDSNGLLSSSGANCAPNDNNGNYIMYIKATDGDAPNNNEFSECSIASMSEVIYAHSSECFEEATATECGLNVLVSGSCGNGLLDVSEPCDCSATGGVDPHCDCATCNLQSGFTCSHAIDSVCCSPSGQLIGLSLADTIAKYQVVLSSASVTRNGSLSDVNSALDIELDAANRCGSDSPDGCTMNRYCINDPKFVPYLGQGDGYCPNIDFVANMANPTSMQSLGLNANDQPAAICYNFTDGCSAGGLDACAAEVKSCIDAVKDNTLGSGDDYCFLFHRSNLAKCNGDTALCRFNGCTGSVCSSYNKEVGTPGPAQRCRIVDNAEQSCDLACNFDGDDPDSCTSTRIFGSVYPNSNQTQTILFQPLPPGRACAIDSDRYGGRCNEVGVCQSLSTDLSTQISAGAVSDWIQDNWGLVLGIVVGGIILGILLKVTYVKKKPEIKAAAGRMAATIRRRTGMPKMSSSSSRPAIAGRPPLTSHMRNELRHKMKKEDAIERLQAFFPKTERSLCKQAMKASRNEEDAVKYLLKRKQPFAVPNRVPLLSPDE